MNDTLTSKLGSFQATLAVADKDENKPIWQSKPPLAFNECLLGARTAVAGLARTGAEQSAAIRGSTDALRGLRTQFENALHPFARATFRCLKNTGENENAVKVDFTPSDLRNARAVALAGIGEIVLNLAEPVTKSPGNGQPAPGEKYGVTAAKFAEVDELWTDYSTAVGAPASARARRKAITDALPSQFAATEEKFAELDDLVIQFRGSEASDRFVEAWFNARRVVDTGRRAARPNPAVVVNTTSSTPQVKAA
jgi:hypothetical protein